MRRFVTAATLAIGFSHASQVYAHPAPFSYVDLRLNREAIELVVVAHVFDVAHDLQIEPQDRLLDPSFVTRESEAIVRLLSDRLRVTADGAVLSATSWTPATALPDRQAIAVAASYPLAQSAGAVMLDVKMFPYDPAHQTFVNVYEDGPLTLQAILDASKTQLEYYPGSRQGTWTVMKRFAPVGAEHVLFGLDHLAFLIGLVLLGGSLLRIVTIATMFVAGNAVALAMTMLNLLQPPARLIEPAIALSIVYVGADNLMVRGGRDMRPVIALVFGVIHGFWFANGLRAMDLPTRTIGWSLFSFDVGLDFAQVVVVLAAGTGMLQLWLSRPELARRVATTASSLVIVAGVYWFVQKVFFPGGWL